MRTHTTTTCVHTTRTGGSHTGREYKRNNSGYQRNFCNDIVSSERILRCGWDRTQQACGTVSSL